MTIYPFSHKVNNICKYTPFISQLNICIYTYTQFHFFIFHSSLFCKLLKMGLKAREILSFSIYCFFLYFSLKPYTLFIPLINITFINICQNWILFFLKNLLHVDKEITKIIIWPKLKILFIYYLYHI